jgi:hypothetical protein
VGHGADAIAAAERGAQVTVGDISQNMLNVFFQKDVRETFPSSHQKDPYGYLQIRGI